ncbi:MAG: glycerophosphodiester phosphodiesterase family protein [Patescibacteria group bacterium]
MLIFAHRGLKLEQPENTMEAFRAAHAAGFGIELDVRLTADGDLVCIHDLDPARVAGPSSVTDVHAATEAELQALNVAQVFWQFRPVARIPRFMDVAAQVIAKFVPMEQSAAIHVKAAEQGDTQLGMIVDAFQQYDLYGRAFVFDLTLESAAKVRAMDPWIQIFISVSEYHHENAPSIYLWNELAGHENIYDGVWWDEWNIAGAEYRAERAAEIRAKGKS